MTSDGERGGGRGGGFWVHMTTSVEGSIEKHCSTFLHYFFN